MMTSAQNPINQVSLEIDEDFRNLMPPLTKKARAQLEESIREEGCREPLVVWECDGKQILLDGHNRHAICEANNIPYHTVVKTQAEIPDREAAMDWIDRNQLARRNLTPRQFTMVLGRRYNRQKTQHGGDRKSSGQNEHLIFSAGKTAERLAKEHGTSAATVRRAGEFAEAVEKAKEQDPDIEQKVIQGKVSRKEVLAKAKPAAPSEKEQEPPKDPNGHEIPAYLVDVFATQKQFQQFAQNLSTLKGQVRQAIEANPVAWSQFNENAFRAAIGRCHDLLTLNAPFAVCSYCGASESDKCRACVPVQGTSPVCTAGNEGVAAMTFALRDYQTEAVNKTLEAFQAQQAVLTVLATGLGKTIVAAHIANAFKDKGRILLLAHREELIFQGQEKLESVTGIKPEIEMADSWAGKGLWGSQVVVSTIQTQIAGRDGGRMTRFDPKDFSLVIVDEAHHATAASYRAVLDHYRQNPNLKTLGLTATPDRADEEALGQIFDAVAFEFDILNGIDAGWLVPIMQQAVFVEGLDYSAIRTTAGDLNGKDLSEVLEYEENLHGMTTPILDLCQDRKTLIFAATVAQAGRMAEILNRHKPESAEYVCGTTPKEYRRRMFGRYAEGKFQYLVNVGVATEGFDEPAIECIVMARPTKSRSLFAQMAGRGTRPLPGIVEGVDTADARKALISLSAKPCMTIIDFAGNAGRHKLIHAADILGGKYSDEIVELANRNVEREDKPVDVTSELVKAEREIDRRRRAKEEAAMRAKIKLRSQYNTTAINPFDVLDIIPCREPGWHKGRMATERQKACLNKFGVTPPDNLSFVHASQLIDQLIKRAEEGRPTYKQCKLLNRYGYRSEEMTFAQASEAITAIAANGWRRPA